MTPHLVVVAILSSLAILSAGIAAQERRALPHGGEAYLPLRPGALWTYRRTDTSGRESTVELWCRGLAESGRYRGHELVLRGDGQPEYEYWRADAQGVWRYAKVAGGRVPGLRSQPPGRWLAAPVGVETTWEFEETVPPWGGSGVWPKVTHRATVEAFSEAVEVPAGTLEAIKVRIEFTWPDTADGERTFVWFAPGKGIVRREVWGIEGGEATLRTRDDLVAFEPGPESVEDPRSLAARFVAAHPELWPEGSPRLEELELPLGSSAVLSRFVVASGQNGKRLLAMRGGEVAEIDFDRVDTLQALWTAEGGAASVGSQEMTRFATLVLTLRRALESGKVTPVRFNSTGFSGQGGPGGVRHQGTFRQGDATVVLEVLDGKLTRLTFKE